LPEWVWPSLILALLPVETFQDRDTKFPKEALHNIIPELYNIGGRSSILLK
jgi:hypothetical protein